MTEEELAKLRNIEQSLILLDNKFKRRLTLLRVEVEIDFKVIRNQIQQVKNLQLKDEEQ